MNTRVSYLTNTVARRETRLLKNCVISVDRTAPLRVRFRVLRGCFVALVSITPSSQRTRRTQLKRVRSPTDELPLSQFYRHVVVVFTHGSEIPNVADSDRRARRPPLPQLCARPRLA